MGATGTLAKYRAGFDSGYLHQVMRLVCMRDHGTVRNLVTNDSPVNLIPDGVRSGFIAAL